MYSHIGFRVLNEEYASKSINFLLWEKSIVFNEEYASKSFNFLLWEEVYNSQILNIMAEKTWSIWKF